VQQVHTFVWEDGGKVECIQPFFDEQELSFRVEIHFKSNNNDLC